MAKKESPQDKLYNLQAQQLAAQVANWAAQLDFQKERFRLLEMPQFQSATQLEVDKLAWQKAQDTWERAFQESTLTGTYNGQPTTQWLMDQAKLTGSFNGQQTLEGKLTDAQIQDMHDKMNLANTQFLAATTGYLNGQKTFDREKFEAAQALEGWKFISTLTGPQNAFKQARAIASAPGGMTQLMDAFAGQYMLPGSAAVGSGGAGGADPNGQLNDLRMGWGGDSGHQAPPTPYGSTVPESTPQYNPTPYGPQPAFVPAPTYVTPAPVPPATTPTQPTTPTEPTYTGPPWASFNPIPRPSDPDYATTKPQWDAAHPGYTLDTSNVGFHSINGAPMPIPEGPHITPADIAAAKATWGGANGGYTLPAPSPWVLAGAAGTAATTSAQGAAGYSYQPPGVQAPSNAYNYSATRDGSVAVYPPGVVSPAQTADVSSTTPQNPASVSGVVNQPYQYQGATTNGMLAPNQINAQNYENAYDYQKQLLWAGYEDAGMDKGLAQESYLRSLPKYGGPTKGAIAF